MCIPPGAVSGAVKESFGMNVVLTSVIILFSLVFVGYVIGKRRIVRQDCAPDLSNLILRITMPVTVFCSMVGQEDLSLLDQIWKMVLMALIFHLVTWGIGLCVVKVLKIPQKEQGIWIFNCMFSNNGFMGFPLALSLWGADGLFLMAIANMVTNFFIFSVGLKALTRYYPVKETINVRKMFVNNLNIAVMIGFVCYLLQLRLPAILLEGLGYLSEITAGLSMLVVGLSLSRMRFRSVFENKKIFLLAGIRLLLLPLLCIGVLRALPFRIDPMLELILVLMSALPAASSQTILTEQYGTNTRDASRAILVTTLLCVGTIPLVMKLSGLL